MSTATAEEATQSGLFLDNLKRSNEKIKADRAEGISEDAETTYRRTIEDMRMEKRRLERDRRNMLDLSASTTYSLIVGKDFDAKKFVEADLEIGVKLREVGIKLEIAEGQFKVLFGKEA